MPAFPRLAVIVAATITGLAFADSPRITRDIHYTDSKDLNLSFDVCRPAEPNNAAVLYIVSGGWYSRRFDPNSLFPDTKAEKNVFGKLVDEGFTVFLVRHRSAPRHKVPEAVEDVRNATRFIRQHADEYAVKENRFGAMGASAGGHLSLMLGVAEGPADESGVSDRVQAVVAYCPPTDLRPILGFKEQFPALDFDPQLAASVSPLAHVSPDDAPTLLVHGTADRLVPLLSSQAIHAAFVLHGVQDRLLPLQGAGHGFRGQAAIEANDAAVVWFKEKLLNIAPAEGNR